MGFNDCASCLTADPSSVGVPLGWLFLAIKQLLANYKWRCDCIQVTTSMQAMDESMNTQK